MIPKKLFSEIRLSNFESENHEGDPRLPVEKDYGRVIFCSAFRRLHDKTQVFPLVTNDNIHSRLTHSMEVASVGRSLSLRLLKEDEFRNKFRLDNNQNSWRKLTTLIEVVCLAHDIGNPPFGHFGETIIQNYFKTLCEEIMNNDELISEQALAILKSEKCRIDKQKMNDSSIACAQLSEVKENSFIASVKELIKLGHKFLISLTSLTCGSRVNDFSKCCIFSSNTELDYTQFDGNAEGFRVLTKLQFLDNLFGLDLTSASLSAFLKYPNIGSKNENQDSISCHKHGVFTTEKKALEKVMGNCGINAHNKGKYYDRHPISFIMEAADTICYRAMDIEDAITKGWISYEEVEKAIKDDEKTKQIIESLNSHCGTQCPTKKKMVHLRTELMNVMVKEAADSFIENIDEIFKGTYKKELLTSEKSGLEMKLGGLCEKYIYNNKEIQNLELTGEAVLTGLLNYYIKYLFHEKKEYRMHCKRILSKGIFMATLQEHLDKNKSEEKAWDKYEDFDPKDMDFEEKLRIIRDHVACMTDQYALEQYRQLMGVSL